MNFLDKIVSYNENAYKDYPRLKKLMTNKIVIVIGMLGIFQIVVSDPLFAIALAAIAILFHLVTNNSKPK